MESLIVRRSEAAAAIGVSESQFIKWERAGWITAVRYPGIRAVGYVADEVRDLARRIIDNTTPVQDNARG